MAQNVTVAGASYSDVPSVVLPLTGGGSASFLDTTIASNAAAASDITSGKLAYVNGALVTGTNSGGGGGGASNLVTGTFKGTTTGAAMDVTLSYTGSGYPIVFVVFPKEGPYNSSSGTFYSLIQRFATVYYMGIKAEQASTPTYTTSGSVNAFTVMCLYKSSASSSTTYSQAGGKDTNVLSGNNASSGSSRDIVRFKSATKMSVFIANTSYGFAANIDYAYYIIYSS